MVLPTKMSEILNLSEVCRCCHSSGLFKSLLDPFTYEGNVEVYSDLIRDVLGIHIQKPPFAASHTICEQCIMQLRFCRSFKQQVLKCERKFQEYCKNQLCHAGAVKTENDDEGKGAKPTSAAGTNSKDTKHTHQTPSYSCEFCHQQFDKKEKLREHEINKHYNEALSCKICELTFKNHATRTMHMKKHNSTGNGLRCKHCDKYYGSEKALIEHINSHFNNDIFQCEMCPKKFPYKYTLQRHKEWHKQKFTESHIRLHKCNVCSMAFRKSSELRTHKVCTHKLLYNEQRRLKTRMRRRNGLFQCSDCDKIYTSNYNLNRHITVIHHRVNRHKCNSCNLTFSISSGLYRHMRNVHGGKKKEKCNICNKLCTNLKEHIKVHTKPYKCERCFKSFPAKNSLNRHIKFVHVGVRPFSCDQCDITFRKVELYRKHLRKVHNVDVDQVKTESNGDTTDRIENISDGIDEVISRLHPTS